MKKLNGIYIINSEIFKDVYSKEDKQLISTVLNIDNKVYTRDDIINHPSLLSNVNVIMSSWGAPILNNTFFKSAPNLKAFFYAAGSIRSFITNDFWDKDIVLASAWAANAIPVAEFTFAQIILSLKNMWKYTSSLVKVPCSGTYRSNIGIISLGAIGKLVAQKLTSLDVNVYAYDPFISEVNAKKLNIKLTSLNEIFEKCDVVTIHTPLLPETKNMIKKEHFLLMKRNATFINTSRGAIVNESHLIEVFSKRPDLTALLDVTVNEPPNKDSQLYTMSNIFLTPHIAGSLNKERQRLGHYMTEELIRWQQDKPLKYSINKDLAKRLA